MRQTCMMLFVGCLGMLLLTNRDAAKSGGMPEGKAPQFSGSLWLPRVRERITIIGALTPEAEKLLAEKKYLIGSQVSHGRADSDPWKEYSEWIVDVGLTPEKNGSKLVLQSVPDDHIRQMLKFGSYDPKRRDVTDATEPKAGEIRISTITPSEWWSIREQERWRHLDGGNEEAAASMKDLITLPVIAAFVIAYALGFGSAFKRQPRISATFVREPPVYEDGERDAVADTVQ